MVIIMMIMILTLAGEVKPAPTKAIQLPDLILLTRSIGNLSSQLLLMMIQQVKEIN